MSNLCLITNLKGSVDNDNLPYYNELRFFLKSSESTPIVFNNSFCLNCIDSVTIKVINGPACLKIDNLTGTETLPDTGYSKEIVVNGNKQLILANVDAEFVIIGKNSIESIYGLSYDTHKKNFGLTDFSQIAYATNLQSFGIGAIQGNSVLSYTNKTDVSIQRIIFGLAEKYTNLGVDIENVPSSVINLSVDSTSSFGDVSVFVKNCPLCKTICVMRTKCTGKIEDICTALKDNAIYNITIGCSKYMTINSKYCTDNNYTFSSSDNGNTYSIILHNETIGTYNTTSQMWV